MIIEEIPQDGVTYQLRDNKRHYEVYVNGRYSHSIETDNESEAISKFYSFVTASLQKGNNMTHEEEMKILRAETAKLRAENDLLQAKIEQQLRDINSILKK